MSHVVCLMNVDADRATFTWSEGPASFEPYTLDGLVYKEFKDVAAAAREKLADLIKEYLYSEEHVPKAAYELAEAGYELYEALFDPGAAQKREARQVRKWLEKLGREKAVDTLEIVVESPWSLPWNVIYDREPDEDEFLENDDSPERWKPFWGLRYNLCGGRKVDPLRRMPILKDPKVLMVIDAEIRDGLPADQQQRLAAFADKHSLQVVTNKDELKAATKAQRPDLLYWLSHAEPDALVLSNEPVTPRNLRRLLKQDDDEDLGFGGLAFLNACQTAEGAGEEGSFFEAFHSVGFAGMIGTEHQTIDQFANPLGLDFLEAFLDRGEPVGTTLRHLRGRVPLGLLYGTYCPPSLRVETEAGRESLDISQLPHVEGIALGAALLAEETELAEAVTRPLPPLPDEPYRSLAYYDRDDRALFAGRDADIERFATMLDDAGARILVLHGESGVGKSSFLHAGVIPYLEEECLGYRFIRDREADAGEQTRGAVLFVRATNDLFGQLANALCDFCARPYEYQTPLGESVSADLPAVLRDLVGDEVNQATVRGVLRSEPAMFGRIMSAISDRLPFAAILVIDQGEEVFTLAQTPEDRQRSRRALDMLRRTVHASGGFKIIFSLRTEYYGRVIDRLRRGLHDTGSIREYLLTDFDEDALLEAIRRPTVDEPIPYTSDVPFEKYGFHYADGVAEEIARRVIRYTTQRRDSVLPLVQVICAQLFRFACQRNDGTITLNDLEALGGIEGGMRKHVEGLLGELLKGRPLDTKPVQKLFTQLYLRQPDGTLTTALLAEDEVRKRWTGRMPFDELLSSSLAMRLLKVNTLRIGMEEERRYVSLGHDALAKLAAQWDEELTRSERVRRTVKKIAAWGAAAVVLLLMIGSFVAWMRHKNEINLARNDADELVKRIKTATPAELPNIIKHELPAHRHWADPQLEAIAATGEPAQRLRASLALMPVDDSQAGWLGERLLDCRVDEFPVIRDSLKPPTDALLVELWQTLHDDDADNAKRFYAGMGVAEYAPESKDWSDADFEFLASRLVSSSADYQRSFRLHLAPIKKKLLKPLQGVFLDPNQRVIARVTSASALAEFAVNDPGLLARLASEATPEQYEIVYASLKDSANVDAARSTLMELIEQQPDASLSESARVRLGTQRAGAAITLIRLGDREQVLNALRVTNDPESLTQFVHRCQERGLGPGELLECLNKADEVSARFGMLLTLAQFKWADVPTDKRDALVSELAQWYRDDPSSAIHSATGWLLRQWGQDEKVAAVDYTPLPYDPRREWFVVEVRSESPQGEQRPDYFTMIVFPAAEFLMGSPDNEANHDSDEKIHPVRFTRPFAISDREVTREQFQHFLEKPDGDDVQRKLTANHPAVRMTWSDAVTYCRWLTTNTGMHETAQYYSDPQQQEKVPEGSPRNWSFDPTGMGFRLPTEAEWECACRAGMRTRYSFGSDSRLLEEYGWYLVNSNDRPQPAAQKPPNLRGLFDMHGNLWEWCHDWKSDESLEVASSVEVDPTGPADGTRRRVRGGSWYYSHRHCRSAYRSTKLPTDRSTNVGFRVCMFVSATKPPLSPSLVPSELSQEPATQEN